MSLPFFAKRIGVNVCHLAWVIIRTKNEDGDITSTPAISIKGESQCFNILTDTVETLVNIGGCETTVFEASMSETADGYIFRTSDGECLKLSFEEIDNVYKNKIYSKELARKAKRFS